MSPPRCRVTLWNEPTPNGRGSPGRQVANRHWPRCWRPPWNAACQDSYRVEGIRRRVPLSRKTPSAGRRQVPSRAPWPAFLILLPNFLPSFHHWRLSLVQAPAAAPDLPQDPRSHRLYHRPQQCHETGTSCCPPPQPARQSESVCSDARKPRGGQSDKPSFRPRAGGRGVRGFGRNTLVATLWRAYRGCHPGPPSTRPSRSRIGPGRDRPALWHLRQVGELCARCL